MANISRRDFLKHSLMGLGAVTLAGCTTAQVLTQTNQPPSPVSPSSVPTAAVLENTATSLPTAQPAGYSYLSVVRGGENPELLVRKALAAIGGIERFVPKGASVIIKPNMCVPAPMTVGATTNPIVVGTLVKMCFEAGAQKVKVLDYPFGGTSDYVYEACGIAPSVIGAGGEMEVISDIKFVKTSIPKGKSLKEAAIYDEILKTDVLINVPVAKNHSMAKYTAGLKNMMGIVQDRPAMHTYLDQSIADLNTRVVSTLTVVDAVRIMLRNGPTGGSQDDIKKIDTVIASPDIVAADSYAITLFDDKPENIGYINYAVEHGLGRSDLKNLKIEEINVG